MQTICCWQKTFWRLPASKYFKLKMPPMELQLPGERLPDMRGTQAARILRQDKETNDIPIVFVTSSVMADGIEEIKDITNTGFISKPINTRTFVKELSQFIK
jgi:CheY-like chemotaxis protein